MMKLHAKTAVTLCTVAMLISGCATTGDSSRLFKVRVSSSGAITFRGGRLALGDLPAVLKGRGATGSSRIQVSIPSGMPSTLMRQIDRTLRVAGFRKIHYTGPRHAESFAGEGHPTKRRAF